MPPIKYKTTEEKKQALRDNALRCYYNTMPDDRKKKSEILKIKRVVKDFLKDEDNYRKVYDFLLYSS